jgi:hypothetical protein
MDQNARWQASLLEAMHRSSDRYDKRVWDGNALRVSTYDQFYRGYAEHFRHELLVHLHHIEMKSRSESVSDASDETFQWIFSPLSAADQKWSNFVQFLESDQGLYWITGKPGSGKSTLMKFIINDQRTAAHLSKWAGCKELYLTGFYFWCSGGNEIQTTLEGLVRTLVHQALEDFPHLVPSLFPKRLETFVVFGDHVVWEEPWVRPIFILVFVSFYESRKLGGYFRSRHNFYHCALGVGQIETLSPRKHF